MNLIDDVTAKEVANSSNKVYSSSALADQDTFLKLLIAQLKNQDPLDPIKDQDFIAQLAQFTSVEKLTSIEKALEGSSMNTASSQAIALVGKTVSVIDPESGDTISGVVTQVTLLGDDAPSVLIGSKVYPLSYVTSVGQPTTASNWTVTPEPAEQPAS